MQEATQRDWEQEYERMLVQGVRGGRISRLPSNSEKRLHPRFKVQEGQILVTEQVPYRIVDLSVSGLAFYSPKWFEVGDTIQVSLRSLIAIESAVLGCDRFVGEDSSAAYRIRCRFLDQDYGLRFLMLALEMEGGPVEVASA